MNGSEKATINGLVLPAALVEAICSGRWVVPPEDTLRAVFPLEPIVQPAFFDLQGMERENRGWRNETLDFYLGKKGACVQPGDIDPTQSVVIADLGPDRLIALDYRMSKENPSVVYLTTKEVSQWVEAASDVETLIRLLGLY